MIDYELAAKIFEKDYYDNANPENVADLMDKTLAEYKEQIIDDNIATATKFLAKKLSKKEKQTMLEEINCRIRISSEKAQQSVKELERLLKEYFWMTGIEQSSKITNLWRPEISGWIRGHRKWSIDKILKICGFINKNNGGRYE